MIPKTLFVSDLDGTLLNSQGELSARTVEMLKPLMENGVLFSIATARSLASAGGFFAKLPFACPVILMNGVFLYDVQKKAFLQSHAISPDVVKQVLCIYEQAGRWPYKYSFDSAEISVEYRSVYHQYDEQFIASRAGKYRSFCQVDTYSFQAPTVFINALDTYEKLAPVYQKLSELDGVNSVFYKDTYSPDMWFLESFSGKANKANAVQELKKRTGADRVVVFGDNFNDIPMFQIADEGYAMQNAIGQLKEIATDCIGSNDQDGVATYLFDRYHEKTPLK